MTAKWTDTALKYVWVHVLNRVSTAERSGKRPSLPSLLQWEGSCTIMEHFRCKKIFVNIEECFSEKLMKNFIRLFSVQLWSSSPLWLWYLYLICREWISPHSTVVCFHLIEGPLFVGSHSDEAVELTLVLGKLFWEQHEADLVLYI